MKIAFFGSSLVSAYWNGAATYHRGIIRALHALGHEVTFFEPDVFERQRYRDLPDPDWARVVVYRATPADAEAAVAQARGSALVIKAGGVGVHDALLEAGVLELRSRETRVAFWDLDAPATIERLRGDPRDAFRPLIPRYDLILTYGGGPPVVEAYHALGARACMPIYNALDPTTHHPARPEARFAADLGFLGNRLPDREQRVEAFFLSTAQRMRDRRFVLGGSGWRDKPMPPNVNYLGHVFMAEHNAFNCTPRAVLAINRDSLARCGFSPPSRVFEAAGAGACIITDAWDGIAHFLEPGEEVLIASSGDEVEEQLRELSSERAARIGAAARRRVLAQHTYTHQAAQLDGFLTAG
jgi:spore maturation protein CgeB